MMPEAHALSHPESQKTKITELVQRARAAHSMLTEAFGVFSAVIDEAEELLPQPPEAPLGVVLDCEHCKNAFSERRGKEAPDYGYCTGACYSDEHNKS